MYRKFGRTVRFENGYVVRIDEAGQATDDEVFTCRPISGAAHFSAPFGGLKPAAPPDLPQIDAAPLERALREIESLIVPPLAIERLVVSEGIAEHQFGDRRWRETTRRVHLSITCRSIRALVDLGDFDLDDVCAIAEALSDAGDERAAPPRIRLAPNVAAALLPSLVGVTPPNVRLWQSAGGFDGNGDPIDEFEITTPPKSAPPWPNVYRPSYRTRPIRKPFHLRATCDITTMEDRLPRGIALLAPPDGLMLQVLCIDGDDAYPTSVRVARIDAIATPARWYPYGAGSFGSETTLASS